MATTARIAAKVAAENYTASIVGGSVGSFMAHDLLPGEVIEVLASDAAGTYSPYSYIDEGGKKRFATLTASHNGIVLNGPIDFRFSKPITINLVELCQFS